MIANFYKCTVDKNHVTKVSSSDIVSTANVEIITPADNILDPILRLSSNKVDNQVNYVYLTDLHRFYYINKWDMENGYITAQLHCDVLASWKTPLLGSEVIVKRNENSYNTYFNDEQMKVYAPKRVKTIEFQNGFDPNVQAFYLAVTNAEGAEGGETDPPEGGQNYSMYVIAAMCGNFWTESNINPAIWESLNSGSYTDLMKGYGLGQWTNTSKTGSGARLINLNTWITSNGYDMYSGNAQLQYIKHENTWYKNNSYPFSTLTEFLESDSTNLTELTHAWNQCWEGIHDSSWDTRVTQAQTVYNYLVDHYDDASINTWVKGNRYLSNSEILNNAVMVYKYFNG